MNDGADFLVGEWALHTQPSALTIAAGTFMCPVCAPRAPGELVDDSRPGQSCVRLCKGSAAGWLGTKKAPSHTIAAGRDYGLLSRIKQRCRP